MAPARKSLDAVFQAVADMRPLSCRVPNGDGLERRLVHPLALLLYKDALHCLAFDPDRERVQTFELGTMRSAHLEEGHFEAPDDFALDDYLQGQFGLWRTEGEPHRVVIDLDAQRRRLRAHPKPFTPPKRSRKPPTACG